MNRKYLNQKTIYLFKYIRSTILPSKPAQLLIQTGLKWDRDNGPGMAASLAYFAIFSLFPMLLIVLSIVGWLIGPNTEAFQTIQETAQQFLPPEIRDLVRDTAIALNENSVGAGIVGFSVLLWTASSVFAILRNSMNTIWHSSSRASEGGTVFTMMLFFVTDKLFSCLLVLGTALLLLAPLISDIAIKTILKLVTTFQATFSFIRVDELQLTTGLQASSSVLILALACCILYKILPSVSVCWGDVWLGALLAALLLVGLQQLVSNSVITIGSHFLSYGVVGSVMILLLWIFLTCQIFLLGGVFSYVYAHLFGSRRHSRS